METIAHGSERTYDREFETSLLDGEFGGSEIVGSLFGERVKIFDTFSDGACLATIFDQIAHADRSPIDALPVTALEDEDDLVHLRNFGNVVALTHGVTRNVLVFEHLEPLGEGFLALVGIVVAVDRHLCASVSIWQTVERKRKSLRKGRHGSEHGPAGWDQAAT